MVQPQHQEQAYIDKIESSSVPTSSNEEDDEEDDEKLK